MPRVRLSMFGVLLTGSVALATIFPLPVGATRAGQEDVAPSGVRIVAAEIDGRSLMSGTRDKPVRLDPRDDVPLKVTVQNQRNEGIHVRYLRISGYLLGLRFVRFQADVRRDIAAGSTVTISLPADFFDVDRAAIGWIDASLQVVDQDRTTMARQPFVADVRGRLLSSVGVLFFEALGFSLICVADIIFGLARRRLPRNRFVRAVLFALAGLSGAVAIIVALSMMRIVLLEATTWVPAVLLSAAIGFVLGYLSPGPIEPSAHEEAEDMVLDLVAAEAVARASGQTGRITTGEVMTHASGDHTAAVAAQHDSGQFAAPGQHDSGQFAAPGQHDSGEFSPPKHHDSGDFAPPKHHDSGEQTPLQ